jgi:hypothetical protein
MPTINFPDSPTVGTIYIYNNISWIWNGSSWVVSSPSYGLDYVSSFNGFTGAVNGTSIPRHWMI